MNEPIYSYNSICVICSSVYNSRLCFSGVSMNVPYNNGKVSIGKYYVPPKYVEKDSDMLELQSYLIHDPARLNRAYWTEKALLIMSLFVVLVVFLKS